MEIVHIKTTSALRKGEPVKIDETFVGHIERLDHKDKIISGSDDWNTVQEKMARVVGYSLGDYRAGDIAEIMLKK